MLPNDFNLKCAIFMGGKIEEVDGRWHVINWSNEDYYPNSIIGSTPITMWGTEEETYDHILGSQLESYGAWGKFHSDITWLYRIIDRLEKSGCETRFFYNESLYSFDICDDNNNINIKIDSYVSRISCMIRSIDEYITKYNEKMDKKNSRVFKLVQYTDGGPSDRGEVIEYRLVLEGDDIPTERDLFLMWEEMSMEEYEKSKSKITEKYKMFYF